MKHGWDYDLHPNKHIVGEKCSALVSRLSDNKNDLDSTLDDTRSAHQYMFEGTTPDNCAYFAGNYRGAPYPYLATYQVEIAGYPGCSYELVHKQMYSFSNDIRVTLQEFYKTMREWVGVPLSNVEKILRYTELISHFFVKLLEIHPYANGNGHIARLVVWILLKKEGLSLDFWSIDERPAPPLDFCIGAYREGKMDYLIKYFLIGIISGRAVTLEDFGVKPH